MTDETKKIQFELIGLVNNQCFQKCKLYLTKLCLSYPKIYEKPIIRPMFDVQWNDFFTKARRTFHSEKIWRITKPVLVFKDLKLIGDDQDLIQLIRSEYSFILIKDYEQIAKEEVKNYFQNQYKEGHDFTYFIIAIDDKIIGTLLFELYTDLLPETCFRFMRLCKRKHLGYLKSPIQRIALPSWIQCGGWKIKHRMQVCENYIISHDRRGVLSMCNNGRHNDNSTQFFITLSPAPWMDYKYVAFGQLIHGEKVLKTIENVPTYYESPLLNIQIIQCGEFTLYEPYDEQTLEDLEKFICNKPLESLLHPRDVESRLIEERYLLGRYFMSTDMQSHQPFVHLPDYLLDKEVVIASTEEEQEKNEEIVLDQVKLDSPLSSYSGDTMVDYLQEAHLAEELEYAEEFGE